MSVVIFPTLWSGPWIWREQRDIFSAAASGIVEIPHAVVNWPIEPTLAAAEAHCLATIDALTPPLLLVGASIGGLIALRIALRRPEFVTGVIASGCPGLTHNPGLGFRAKFSVNFEEACAVRAMLLHDTAVIDDELLRDTVAEVTSRDAVRRGAGLMRDLKGYDAAPGLRNLSVPVTLIWGEEDQLSPLGPWRDLAQECPALHFSVIPQAGHVPMLEAPAAFNAALRSALAPAASG
jgi:pimeloyl-ACP methyl ester carboxylesterase